MKKISDELAFILEAIDLQTLGIPEWESHQLGFFNDPSIFTIDNKARQIGWSFSAAVLSLARSHINKNKLSIFLSINQDEANNKITYVKEVYEAIKPDWQIPIITPNKTELVFHNGSRIKSLPCKAPRGYAQPDIYMDEFAHYPHDVSVYAGAVACTTRGGSIRIGSSPLGTGGTFYDIFSGLNSEFSSYIKRSIPWWVVEGLCVDVQTAINLAPKMSTEERVEAFATDRLKLIWDSYSILDFQQEYECSFLDDSISWLPWEIIKRAQEWFMLNPESPCITKKYEAHQEAQILKDIKLLVKSISDNQIASSLAGGMDVGRKNNASEIILLSDEPSDKLPVRAIMTLDNFEFRQQKDIVRALHNMLPIESFLIDETGMGMQIAEELSEDLPEVEGMIFNQKTKRDISVALRSDLESGRLCIPLYKDLSRELHSVQQQVTASNNVVYRVRKNKLHNGDKYWALGLANIAATYATDTVGYLPPEMQNYVGLRYGRQL